jgi:hypothetical protein
LSPITALAELDTLSICDNRISDLSPLAEFDNLASLAAFNGGRSTKRISVFYKMLRLI